MANRAKKVVLDILLIIFSITFIVSAYLLYKELAVYHQGTSEYSSLVEEIVKEEDPNNPSRRVIDFAELKRKNPDTIGWLYIPDTKIDYPVVQAEDNDKYLHTLFTGETNKAGAIFMDFRNNDPFMDENTLIYGHNMRNASMFHDLRYYVEQDFYNNHKVAYFYTEEGAYKLNIFSAYTTHADNLYSDVHLGAAPVETLRKLAASSKIKADFTPAEDSRIVSLSTCAYDYNDARYVLHAVVERAYFGE